MAFFSSRFVAAFGEGSPLKETNVRYAIVVPGRTGIVSFHAQDGRVWRKRHSGKFCS